MSEGVEILETITRPCTVEGVDDRTFRIILTQGLNRQIRRMCEELDYEVVKLRRIRVSNIMLGNLKKGEWRHLTEEELFALRENIASNDDTAYRT